MRRRSIICYDVLASREVDRAMCQEPVPITLEPCSTHACVGWIALNWTACSATCGRVHIIKFVFIFQVDHYFL